MCHQYSRTRGRAYADTNVGTLKALNKVYATRVILSGYTAHRSESSGSQLRVEPQVPGFIPDCAHVKYEGVFILSCARACACVHVCVCASVRVW